MVGDAAGRHPLRPPARGGKERAPLRPSNPGPRRSSAAPDASPRPTWLQAFVYPRSLALCGRGRARPAPAIRPRRGSRSIAARTPRRPTRIRAVRPRATRRATSASGGAKGVMSGSAPSAHSESCESEEVAIPRSTAREAPPGGGRAYVRKLSAGRQSGSPSAATDECLPPHPDGLRFGWGGGIRQCCEGS